MVSRSLHRKVSTFLHGIVNSLCHLLNFVDKDPGASVGRICPYNTRYPNSPGAITDPEYSIEVGVQYYADCVREVGCTSPQDMDKLKLSL